MNARPTIEVTIRFGEPLRKAVGARRVTLHLPEKATLADLLTRLAATYPGFEAAFRGDDLGRANPYVVFLNGRPVTGPNFPHTSLHQGDVVHIVVPVVGGGHG